MKYPRYLEVRLQEIREIIKTWPVDKPVEEVMSWILQFEPSHYDLALRVIKNLNFIGPDDLNTALSVAYSKLLRHAREKDDVITIGNTLYMPIGSDGKSGAMIAYNFRMINDLSSSYFMSKDTFEFVKEGKINNLVLVDDIIATGDQSGEQLKEIAEKARSLGIKNVYLVTAFGFRKGIDRLRDTQVADVFSAVEYDDRDTVMNLDSLFYENLPHDMRQQYWEAISKYYGGYGYGNRNSNGPIGGLIAFYYNTPNCSLNMIWGSNNGWMPLFGRRHDRSAAEPELYSLKEFLETKNDAINVEKQECSIYVEGKTEELFIQELAQRNNNFGYKSVSVISIGPFVSESLITALIKFSEVVFFVTDDDITKDNAHVKSIKEATKDTELKSMGPTMSYFDIDKINKSEYFTKVFGKDFIGNNDDEDALYVYLENKLIKRASAVYKSDNMRELIDNCAKEDKIKSLVKMFQKEDTEIDE